MKKLRISSLALLTASFMPAFMSCTSDRNPFDITVSPVSETARIQLLLDVASTRAGSDLSTDAEKKVSKVSVYVFNGANELETFESDITLSSDKPVEFNVTPGLKTIYAVSSKNIVGTTIGTGASLQDFEETIFSSKLSDLKTSKEFVMIGKSDSQVVLKSANSTQIPASNLFRIELVRLVSKTQVKLGNIDLSAQGFSCKGNTQFRVSQTCDRMRVRPNGTDVFESFTTHTNGTFDGYTVVPDNQFLPVVTGDFTADGCHYLSENIVSNPVAGNTTFVTLSVPVTPDFYYIFDGKLTKGSAGMPNSSFYAVGVVDENNGFEDFVIDPDTKHVITFNSTSDVNRYVNALNGGNTFAVTVSESEAPFRAAATSDVQIRQYQIIHFMSGEAFYRINIKDADGALKVERNKFYKIAVNSIKNLGCHSEALLRPLDPSADADSSTSAWIEAVFTVAEWDEVEQSVDL
ncbi:MAG: hypothetical protein K2N09_08540 [Muribaculaceae bacterium]|nr:hypothetical protein [Muribaculaceae bacterium]